MSTKGVLSKAERTRQFIIEKAAPIFNKKGYAGTSLNDLVQATGLTKGAIYGNFENKQEIAQAVYDFNLERVAGGIRSRLKAPGNSADRLLDMLDFYRSSFGSMADLGGCPIVNTAVDADDTESRLKEKVIKSIKDWRLSIESVIRQGIAAGEIREGVNAGRYSALIIAMIEGALMLSKSMNDLTYLNVTLSQVERIIEQELRS